MNRTKFVASALIGVAVAANAYEPALAQTPGRFIVQPQKPKQTVAPETPAQPISQPVTQPVAQPVTQPAAPSAQEKNKEETVSAPVSTEINVDLLDSFPSLKPATNADLTFDSLDSLATVPSIEFEKEVAKFAETAAETSGPAAGNAEANATPRRNDSQSNPTQLQWTSRPAGNRSPLPQVTSKPDSSSFNSIPSRYSSTTQGNNAFSGNGFGSMNSSVPSATDVRAQQAAQEQAEANNQLLTKIADRMEAIETKLVKAEEPEERARTRAALVSSRITNDPRFIVDNDAELNVDRLEQPQGWQAVGGRLTNHVKNCESLLRRGAFCSAREEADSACVLLIRHIDLIDNSYRCEPAWHAAKQSLREAEDFLAVHRTSDSEGLRRLIDSHQTPILKGKNLAEMSPLTAAQHYRVYAELQLTEATQGHPWASELLYAVGRTYQSEADANAKQVDSLRMKALAYYRAARSTLPSNAVACNQLGYLLLQMDRNEEAREVLASAVSLTNDVATLSNLAEASRRLGDTQTVAWAAQNVAAIRSRLPQQAPVPPFVELTPEEFASISPRSIGPKPATESTNDAPVAPTPKSAAAPGAFQLR